MTESIYDRLERREKELRQSVDLADLCQRQAQSAPRRRKRVKRYVSANIARNFSDLQEFLRALSSDLSARCECDGRGCVICISADALIEAADELRAKCAAQARVLEKLKAWLPTLREQPGIPTVGQIERRLADLLTEEGLIL